MCFVRIVRVQVGEVSSGNHQSCGSGFVLCAWLNGDGLIQYRSPGVGGTRLTAWEAELQ